MISYIKGEITYKNPAQIIVETNDGVGYEINISLHTFAQIEKLDKVKILTFLHIKEDAHTLFGFAEESERSLFVLLLSVSGVGTNTARLLLSSMNPEELKSAIVSENVITLSKVKGIGPKTAKRIILDLKDKLLKDGGEAHSINLATPQHNTLRDEALSALVILGFNKIEVQKVLNKLLKEQPNLKSVEDVIKASLKLLS